MGGMRIERLGLTTVLVLTLSLLTSGHDMFDDDNEYDDRMASTGATMRSVARVVRSIATSDGAGVKLRRSLGTRALDSHDPFLMLDHFGSDDPDAYIAGFPDHPHRGFKTLTYMIEGQMNHKDSMGNKGRLSSGGLQLMTAGSGIIHSEMPAQSEGLMSGFQLWINLPAKDKMTDPNYQDIQPDQVPSIELDSGAVVKLFAGSYGGHTGPVEDPHTHLFYVDVDLPAGQSIDLDVPSTHNVFVYAFDSGPLFIDGTQVDDDTLATLTGGDAVSVSASEADPTRFILVAGTPLNEPIARGGPIVMSTREEVMQAFADYQEGNFIKKVASGLDSLDAE